MNNKIKEKLDIIDREDRKEGKFVTDLLNLQKQEDFLYDYQILFIVDTIYCPACFKFHINNIKKLRTKKIYSYSPLNYDYVESYITDINKISFNTNKNDIFLQDNLVVALVDKKSFVIYYEIADKNNYEKSKRFYAKLKSFKGL